MTSCSFCNALDSVKSIYGELTCIKCGTVGNTELQDPPHEYNMTNDFDTVQPWSNHTHKKFKKLYAIMEDKQVPSYKLHKQIPPLCAILEHKVQLDAPFIETTRTWFKILAQTDPNIETVKYKKQQNTTCLFVCCCYCVSTYLKRGYDIRLFCNVFDVDRCNAWTALPFVLKCFQKEKWYKTLVDCLGSAKEKISRTVYSLSVLVNLSKNAELRINSTAYSLFQKVQNFPKLDVCKPPNIYLTCIFIACRVHHIPIGKTKYCSIMHISTPTLQSIESLVQESLSQNKYKL